MFSLVKYVKNELKKNQLNEAFDYFNALSDEVKGYITKNYGMKREVGKASKVEILPYNPEGIYGKLVNNKIAVAVLRYGQDDMILFSTDYSGIQPERLSDLIYMDPKRNNYAEQFQLPNHIKSESGFKNICNKLCLFITKINELKKKDVLLKMNFQVIHYDQSKHDIRVQRNIARDNYKPTITRNGVTTPSNQMYDDYSNNYGNKHTKLMQRLKEFIENKIPNILDIKDLPKDVNQLSTKDFQFKFLGDTYKYHDSSRIDAIYVTQGNPFYFLFSCTNNYYQPKNPLLPKSIIFKIVFKNNKFEVIDVLASDNTYISSSQTEPSLSEFMVNKEQTFQLYKK